MSSDFTERAREMLAPYSMPDGVRAALYLQLCALLAREAQLTGMLELAHEATRTARIDEAHCWAAKLDKSLAREAAMREALLSCARQAEALKRPCGMDPESAQAVRNAQYQAISTTAHIALGTIIGPALATPTPTPSQPGEAPAPISEAWSTREWAWLCDLLPADFKWSDPLTVPVLRHILARAATPPHPGIRAEDSGEAPASPTDAGEPHIDGWPLMSGLPRPREAREAPEPVALTLFAQMAAGHYASGEVQTRLEDILGVDLLSVEFDTYDSSLEIYPLEAGDLAPSEEQHAQILALGCSRYWINFSDGAERYCRGPRVQKERNGWQAHNRGEDAKRSALSAARQEGREEAAKVCEAQRLAGCVSEERAYNTALRHAAAAIRALPSQ